MAYFQRNHDRDSSKWENEQDSLSSENNTQNENHPMDTFYFGYDDGFDELAESTDEEEELSEEESAEKTRSRIRFAFGAGNLVAVISGTVLILVLLTLLLSMVNFLMSDLSRNVTLFQTKF